jgi:hypothetical protein
MQRAAHKLGLHVVQSPFLSAAKQAENPQLTREINRVLARGADESYSVQHVGPGLNVTAENGKSRPKGPFAGITVLNGAAQAINAEWSHAHRQMQADMVHVAEVSYVHSGAAKAQVQPKADHQDADGHASQLAAAGAAQVITGEEAAAAAAAPAASTASPFAGHPATVPMLSIYRDFLAQHVGLSSSGLSNQQLQHQGLLFFCSPLMFQQQQQQQQQSFLQGSEQSRATAHKDYRQQQQQHEGLVGVDKRRRVHSSTRVREHLKQLSNQHEVRNKTQHMPEFWFFRAF